ncbi:hypothetical protein [Kitasatospora sp. NPDC001527]|uniref:hypothetical protein n=1 Tax=Kitasatospora sp. NPDC001527 TaxID=3154519 RepID=UPI00331B435E
MQNQPTYGRNCLKTKTARLAHLARLHSLLSSFYNSVEGELMSDFDHTTPPAQVQGWPDPTTEQLSIVARILGPHVLRARAERLATEQASSQRSVGRVAA